VVQNDLIDPEYCQFTAKKGGSQESADVVKSAWCKWRRL